MAKKFKKSFLILLVSIIALFVLAFKDNQFEIAKNLDIFATLFREVNLYYVDEIQPGDLVKSGIDGMLEKLDPYTNFYPESDIEDARFMTTGQYGGIGALVSTKDGYILITEPYENSPAAKAGLQAGDLLIEIEGKSTKDKSTSDVVKVLKGQPNTPVKVLVEKAVSGKREEKTIIREEIKIKNVPYFGMLDSKTGYIRLTGFTEEAGREVRDALVSLKDNNKAEQIILDLRGNPGGLLREAVNIVNVFVEKGVDIVSTKGKVKDWDKSYKTLNNPTDLQIPLAVLVNRASASASEIVSGGLQDLDRAVVIGQRTFGKGLVQTTRPLSYNTQLKVTTSKYYIPSGRCIQAKDYSNRNEDGSVGNVPDSLIKEFKTRNGRKVYDGGGVNPDISIPQQEFSNLARSLLSKRIIFDFVTTFYAKNPSIEPPASFTVNDALFAAFKTYIKDKEYDYTTASEKALQEWKEAAQRENYFDAVEKEYNALSAKMQHDKEADLKKNEAEIRRLIAEEIVSRYYYQRGKIEFNARFDPEIQKALETLNNRSFYNDVLAGKYSEPLQKKGK